MDSPYLQQALAAMGQPMQPQAQLGIDPAMLAQVIQQRRAAQAVPGVPGAPPVAPPTIGQNLAAAGANLRALPQRIGAIPGQVATSIGQLPGLFGLGRNGGQ